MGNTTEDWKRTPTAAAALFGVELPYRPPDQPLAAVLWRRRMWFETTTGLSLLEPWEKVTMLIIVYCLFTLTITGLWTYLPAQLTLMEERTVYYVFGQEVKAGAVVGVHRLVSGLVGHNATREL